jgi:hypothetical protein
MHPWSLSVSKKSNSRLTEEEKALINTSRVSEWGIDSQKDFGKDYEPDTVFFFVKVHSQVDGESKERVVALGGLRPIQLLYQQCTFDIYGICCIIAIEKKCGYGRILIQSMIDYMSEKGTLVV